MAEGPPPVTAVRPDTLRSSAWWQPADGAEGPGPAASPRPAPELLAEVRRRTARGEAPPAPEVLAGLLRGLPAASVLGREDLHALARAVRAEIGGAGPLQPWLDRPEVTDVLVNGPGQVWVDAGHGLRRVATDLGDAAAVRALAVRLAAAAGQRLDDAAPVADGRLPDGTRLHAVLPPVSPAGALLSLRVARHDVLDVAALVVAGTLPPALADLLALLVARRANLLVTGATGTGKTTLLAALLGLVPADQRIVCIEEVEELRPDHPHVVHLVARRANVERAGDVGLADLVRHALRMRPDRLVLGECRGAEVRDVLMALNTGHEGGCTTMHANRVQDVPARLEALGSLAGMTRETVAAQVVAALDAVVHLRRDGPRRHVAQVGIVARQDGVLAVRSALEVGDGRLRAGPAWDVLARRWDLDPDPVLGRHRPAGDGAA